MLIVGGLVSSSALGFFLFAWWFCSEALRKGLCSLVGLWSVLSVWTELINFLVKISQTCLFFCLGGGSGYMLRRELIQFLVFSSLSASWSEINATLSHYMNSFHSPTSMPPKQIQIRPGARPNIINETPDQSLIVGVYERALWYPALKKNKHDNCI